MFWLLIIQGILILIEIAVFCTLILRSNRKNNKSNREQNSQPQNQPVVIIQQPEVKKEPRELIGITADTGVVAREFKVGDEFNCEGLLINADFNQEPVFESIVEYSVVDEESFERMSEAGEVKGCYVIKPDLTQPGKKSVAVKYENMTAYYTISVEPEQEEHERTLLYITLDTDNVQKEFTEGDALNYDGLRVTAVFNTEPTELPVEDYSVLAPDMSKEGNPTVTVVYQDKSVGYRITVNALPEEERKHREAQLIEEESYAAGTLRYDRSFEARLIQSDDDVKRWYTDIKNELLSFKKVHNRYSWKRETYKAGRASVAKLAFRGKTMCLYLPLNAADFADTKYHLEDVSGNPSNADTPSMYRIKSDRRAKYALDLIGMAMEKSELPRIEHIAEDFYMPYEGIVELIKKGLVKRNIKSAEEEAFFNQGKAEAAATEEEPSEPQEIAPGIFVAPKTE